MRSLWCVGLLLVLAGHAGAGEPDHAVAQSVVKLRGLDASGRIFYGSGVAVGVDAVATNCHVTRNAAHVAILRGAQGFPVRGQRADVRRDVCLLDVPGLHIASARLGHADRLKPGQPLNFYGYPRALGLSFSRGDIKALHRFDDSRIIETNAFFTLGGSGGGLFDDAGRLVGLATFLAPGHAGAYYAIPADWIGRVKKTRLFSPLQPVPGLSFWEQERTRLPAFLRGPGR